MDSTRGSVHVDGTLPLKRVIAQNISRNTFQVGAQNNIEKTLYSIRNVAVICFDQFGNEKSSPLVFQGNIGFPFLNPGIGAQDFQALCHWLEWQLQSAPAEESG